LAPDGRKGTLPVRTCVLSARDPIVAHHPWAGHAPGSLARVERAGVVIQIACRASGLLRIHAPARRVARPRVLTLVLGNTHHRLPARAPPALAGVGLRAHVAVVTLRRCRHLDTPRFGAECLAEISTAVAWPTALPAVARVAVDVTIAVVF